VDCYVTLFYNYLIIITISYRNSLWCINIEFYFPNKKFMVQLKTSTDHFLGWLADGLTKFSFSLIILFIYWCMRMDIRTYGGDITFPYVECSLVGCDLRQILRSPSDYGLSDIMCLKSWHKVGLKLRSSRS